MLACLLALVAPLRADVTKVAPPLPSSAPSPSPSGASSAATSSPAPASSVAPASKPTRSGLTPLPGDKEVPLEWMPPGSQVTPVPSDEIFPPQTITIRFNHTKHVQELKQPCTTCHLSAYTSNDAKDRLMPAPTTCDGCHDASHADLKNVKAGKGPDGQCSFCHLGDKAGEGGKVAPMVIPTPNLIFPHQKHLARNIKCAQCHGQVAKLELATRDQLPRMAGCFTCHAKTGAAQGDAKGDCVVCHVAQPNGRLKTNFSGAWLLPPQWLHMAAHTSDWTDRHKVVASTDSAFCGSCHAESECADCHDGRVRSRKVHPGDWMSMHAQSARQDSPRCVSCHQEQTFCADCHRRVGVARDGPSGNAPGSRRFHPPPAIWTTAPRSVQHHAWEAQKNLNACVSCHSERDCATCHATKGVRGGQGVSPHPPSFAAGCGSALKQNPRPCLVCHQSGDASLSKCR